MFEGSCGVPYSVPLAPISTTGAGNGSGNGLFGGDGWWAIIIFALIFGWGRGGYGGFGGGNGSGGESGSLTRGELCQDMNFQSLENAVRGVQSGLCDGFYAMNTGMLNGFSGIQNTLCQGFAEIAAQGNNNTNALQQSLNAMNISNMQTANAQNIVALQNQNALQTQISNCCCGLEKQLAQAEYNRATDACAITTAIQNAAQNIINNDNANYRQLHDENVALQIQGYKEQISSLQTALNNCNTQNVANAAVQSVVNQVRPTPVPTWNVPNPFSYGGYGCGCGCSCGCGSAA